MPWPNHNRLLKEKIPTREDIINMAHKIDSPRDQALFILVYLTAGRITELLKELCRGDVKFTKVKERNVMIVEMPNRKNRKQHFKTIPAPIDKEGELIDLLEPWLRPFEPGEVLFNISKIRAYQIFKKVSGFNPHYIRHIRLSHLVIYYDFTDQQLVKFAGWSDSRHASRYTHLSYKDLVEKMI
jgi:integrase